MLENVSLARPAAVGGLLFSFYVRACNPTCASSKCDPSSELSLKVVFFSRVSFASPRALLFFQFHTTRRRGCVCGCAARVSKLLSSFVFVGKMLYFREKRLFGFFFSHLAIFSTRNLKISS